MKRFLIFLLLFITCGGEGSTSEVRESTEEETSTTTVEDTKTNTEKKDLQEVSQDNEVVKALKEASEEAKKCINDKWPNGVETVLGGHTPGENEMGLIYDCLDSSGDKNFEMEKQGRDEEWRGMWEGKCEGTGPVMFNNSPMKIEDINFLMPYGQIVGGHITPIDHMYFYSLKGSGGREAYEVLAIQDAFIFNIETREIGVESQQKQEADYRLDMVHTCTFGSYFDLVTKLSPELEKKWKENRNQNGDFTGAYVKAGEVIGYVGEQSLDFGVYNYNNPLDFINPEAYESLEPWKIYTDDPFLYFPDMMSYFSRDEIEKVHLKARGKSISNAVNVAEQFKNRFSKEVKVEVKNVDIGTEEVPRKDRKGKIKMSFIDIIMAKLQDSESN